MKTIWKFEISGSGPVAMPEGARLLSVQAQQNRCMLWAAVDPAAPLRSRNIFAVATGQEVSDSFAADRPFIGTVLLEGGAFVIHIFDGGQS